MRDPLARGILEARFGVGGIGIDVGTVFTRLAMSTGAATTVLEDSDGTINFPTAVCFDPARLTVGRAALERAWTSAKWLSRASKRLLGRASNHPVVQAHARYVVVQQDEQGKLRLGPEGSGGTPDRALTHVLGHLTSVAARQWGEWPAGAVLCEPGWFEDTQRARLFAAANAAGLAEVSVVPEPVAAVAAVAATARWPEAQRVAVVDVGGGGATVAVLRVGEGRIEILGSAADGEVGGDDVDAALMALALGKLELQGFAVEQVIALELLRQACAAMKRDLGDVAIVSRPLEFARGSGHEPPTLELVRAELEAALGGLVWRVQECCSRALRQADVLPSALDRVLAIGGMTRIPAVRAAIEESLSHRAAPNVDADRSVAIGAALISAARAGLGPRLTIDDHGWCGGKPLDLDEDPPASSRVDPWPEASELRQPDACEGEPPDASDVKHAVAREAMAHRDVQRALPRRAPAHADAPRRGEFLNALGAAEISRLPLGRPLNAADLDPIALPVLFSRWLARKDVTGTLTLTEGSKTLTLPIAEGLARASDRDLAAVTAAFAWPRGSYELLRNPATKLDKQKTSMLRIAIDGLRRVIRELSASEIEEELGQNLHLCPLPRPDRDRAINKLSSFEAGLTRRNLDGVTVGHDVVAHGGASRETMLRLLLLLSAFGALEWKIHDRQAEESLPVRLERMLASQRGANHFEVLGVHWSATTEDVVRACEAKKRLLGPGGEWDRAAPATCAELRSLCEAAFDALREQQRRVSYRRAVYPELDLEAVTDLLDQRARALSLRVGDRSAEADERSTRHTLGELGGRARAKDEVPKKK